MTTVSKNRKYLLMTIKHTTRDHPLFWGVETPDFAPRSFGGYTTNPLKAEKFAYTEVVNKFTDEVNPEGIEPPFPYWAGMLYAYTADAWANASESDLFLVTFDQAIEAMTGE